MSSMVTSARFSMKSVASTEPSAARMRERRALGDTSGGSMTGGRTHEVEAIRVTAMRSLALRDFVLIGKYT